MYRVVALAAAVLLILQILMSLSGLRPPLDLATGVQNQRDPTACEAFGDNWTSCDDAFSSNNVYAYANVSVSSQFARPSSDVSLDTDGNADSWSPSPCYAEIDETTANDADLCQSPNNPTSDGAEVALGSVTDPKTNVSHVVLYRYQKSDARTIDLVVEFREGGSTVVAS